MNTVNSVLCLYRSFLRAIPNSFPANPVSFQIEIKCDQCDLSDKNQKRSLGHILVGELKIHFVGMHEKLNMYNN